MEPGLRGSEAGRESVASPPVSMAFRDTVPHHSAFRSTDSQSSQSLRPAIQDQSPSEHPLPSDVWSGAIARLQTQVSYNTGLAQSNRRDVERIDSAVGRLHQEMQQVFAMLEDVRHELRSRPGTTLPNVGPSRPDPGDVEVLAEQIQSVTNKANEIDGIKMQIELLKRRLKRMEDGGSTPSAVPQRPGTASSTTREQAPYETPYPPQQQPIMQAGPAGPAAQTLPSIRATTQHMSPVEQRPLPGFQGQPTTLSSQSSSQLQQPPYLRSVEPPHTQPVPTQPAVPGLRRGEALPPPSALSSWRPAAEGFPSTNVQLQPRPPAALRAHHTDEPPSSSWASVNQPPKRPSDGQSPYHSPLAGSPKRPRLAPIMPRSNFSEEGYHGGPPSMQHASSVGAHNVAGFGTRSRANSRESQQHLHSSLLPTSASASAGPQSFRFVQSAHQPDSWRPEQDSAQSTELIASSTRGRGKRGGRGGRRSRGGAQGSGSTATVQDTGARDWEREGWVGSQVPSSNGQFQPMHTMSPTTTAYSVRGPGPFADRPLVGGEQHEFPATPQQSMTQLDPYAAADSQSASGGKKTRSKPIRNAEGVLIRKDGRPDMRSVSSANNLRKVHAKKEAERQGTRGTSEQQEEDQTPTSARSGKQGTQSEAEEGDEDDDEEGEDSTARESSLERSNRQRQVMADIYGAERPGWHMSGTGTRYFPQQDEEDRARLAGERQDIKMEGIEEPSTSRGDELTPPRRKQDATMRDTEESRSNTREGRGPRETRRASQE